MTTFSNYVILLIGSPPQRRSDQRPLVGRLTFCEGVVVTNPFAMIRPHSFFFAALRLGVSRFPSAGIEMRNLLLTAVAILFITLTACAPANQTAGEDHTQHGDSHELAGAVLEDPSPAPDFTLNGPGNQPVHLSDFAGRYVFIYFGYTHCPDVCPATLATLARVRRDLGEQASQVQVLMISLDPERDTVDELSKFVGYFDPTFIGLTGSKEQIDAAGKTYGLYYARREGTEATGYLIDHTSRTYLIDDKGFARVAYPFAVTSEQLVADLQWFFAQE